MAVLINLLPDVRIAKERAARQRQLVISISTVVTAASVGLIVLMFLINGALNLRINQLTSSIQSDQQKLESTPNLVEALTVQQHLAMLPDLYKQRVKMTKLLDVLAADSPNQFSLSAITTDASGVIKVTGTAKTYATVQRFATAIEKNNHTKVTGGTDFTNVILGSASGSNNNIAFSLTATATPGVTSNGQ